MRCFIMCAAALALTTLGAPAAIQAQTGPGTTNEGAQPFLLPIGARTVGMGMAAAAAASGSETPWWNPALVARSPRDVGVQVQSNVGALANADVAGVLIYPLPPVGSVAVSARYIGYGEFTATDVNGQPTGTFTSPALTIGATFATNFSRRLAAGFTIKRLVYSVSCSGDCSQLTGSPSVTALDFGAQTFVFSDSTLSLGLTVLNIGPKLQVRDSPQADPLPARGTFGFAYAPKLPNAKDVRLSVAGDVVQAIAGGSSPGYRFGGEVTYLDKFKGRAGYIVRGPVAEGNGATLGGGIVSGRLQIDLAQMLTDAASGSARPTFISLRYVF